MSLTLVTLFTTSFVVAFSGALMPGPLLTVTVSESTRRGALSGGAILLWMAFSMFKSLPELRLELTAKDTQTKNLVLCGVLFSLANPYWIIWWASIGLGYILYSVTFGLLGVAIFFLGHILADLAWYTLISFGVARGTQFFSNTFYRRLIGGCASFLVLFSAYLFYSGLEKAFKAVV